MTRLANKSDAATALTVLMQSKICEQLHRVDECGNRRHSDCARCRAATKGAQAAIDEFSRNAVIEEQSR